MDPKDRKTLKSFFQKGKNPKQLHFEYLIDSSYNKIDDRFDITALEGLKLSPSGTTSKNLLSLYNDFGEGNPEWKISINPTKNAEGLSFDSQENNHRLFLHKNGNIGIHTNQPKSELDVQGTSSFHTRVGGYRTGQVNADGKWHDIITELEDCHVFEIVAKVGAGKGRGKFAIAHAIATGLNRSAHSNIKVSQSYYGWGWFNKLKFRWIDKITKPEDKNEEMRSYNLQVRTRSHYGPLKSSPYQINYHICSLYDDRMFSNLNSM